MHFFVIYIEEERVTYWIIEVILRDNLIELFRQSIIRDL